MAEMRFKAGPFQDGYVVYDKVTAEPVREASTQALFFFKHMDQAVDAAMYMNAAAHILAAD